MVKIARCKTCGKKISQVWNERSNCDKCGGPTEQIEVDMGFSDRIPRVLNIGGVAFMVFAVLYVIYKLIGGGIEKDDGLDIMVLFIAGICFFAASLISQFYLSTRAKEKPVDQPIKRKQRRVKMSPDKDKDAVKSGTIESPKRRTATKVPIKKH